MEEVTADKAPKVADLVSYIASKEQEKGEYTPKGQCVNDPVENTDAEKCFTWKKLM